MAHAGRIEKIQGIAAAMAGALCEVLIEMQFASGIGGDEGQQFLGDRLLRRVRGRWRNARSETPGEYCDPSGRTRGPRFGHLNSSL
ncbi:hypothetical protein BSZ39_10620 [Bowdeniella nasicola]|uniref:Uncharacterized protein n=1 Tax=Bowdeniella nasicola TaxID=208480 RepID=A0A1Q5Q023_9ACTO|nr:hypothetical protein [Bowdeniella nasicola]OKL53228.1 hypothetical protein BSZ39_10620 [Bowdeniella nasicola]